MTDEQVYQAMLKEMRRRTKKTLERCAARKAERELREHWFEMLPREAQIVICVVAGSLFSMTLVQALINIWYWIGR